MSEGAFARLVRALGIRSRLFLFIALVFFTFFARANESLAGVFFYAKIRRVLKVHFSWKR